LESIDLEKVDSVDFDIPLEDLLGGDDVPKYLPK